MKIPIQVAFGVAADFTPELKQNVRILRASRPGTAARRRIRRLLFSQAHYQQHFLKQSYAL